jgi:hypothetical protein
MQSRVFAASHNLVSGPNENAQMQELIPTFASQARFGSMFDGSYDSAYNRPKYRRCASLAVGPIGQGDENTFDEATADEVTK